MEKMLRQLETFRVRGSDGNPYVVRVYEHLARPDATIAVDGGWESTGLAEYRLDDGRRVEIARDGAMKIADSAVTLERAEAEAGA